MTTSTITMKSDLERLNHLEWRLKRLENFIGKSNQSENKRIKESIQDLNETILRHVSNNPNAKTLMNKAEEIHHLTSSDFQRQLMADRSTKLELILADDERIRQISESLAQIDSLARGLDGEYFQEIPKLTVTLNKLLTTHNSVKNQHGQFTGELSQFLQDYASFTLMMDENLQQYKKILQKSQQTSMQSEDRPID